MKSIYSAHISLFVWGYIYIFFIIYFFINLVFTNRIKNKVQGKGLYRSAKLCLWLLIQLLLFSTKPKTYFWTFLNNKPNMNYSVSVVIQVIKKKFS